MDRGNYQRGGGDNTGRGEQQIGGGIQQQQVVGGPPQSSGINSYLAFLAITPNFEIGVDRNMTCVLGRILPPPDLKLGSQSRHHVNDKCQSSLVGKSVVEGKEIQRWALIDFSSKNHRDLKRQVDVFVDKLKDRYLRLGINMEEPVVKHFTHMNELSAVGKVSETKIGIVTQCCLSSNAYYNAKDQFLANLCLKINAKLGGSNMELMERLPNFGSEDNVMFIGADVNHHTGKDSDKCPSIAAVVATVNWPAANRYAARVEGFGRSYIRKYHFGQLSTSKATHYHVLHDEHGFSSDRLQKLIYNMCFTFARCTKPVSLVPPVYYADLVAYRGRMFQEVLMEMNASSSTTSSVSFEQSFYKLHNDLQNIMFFV
ncbi:hypothetical protein MTR67_008787 [Solanum verrucosum]|uniref:Piwi domain-containing protein n=1 Tax=Solanum verrucosum TaxID=315347 RepID=A0AAF0Q251_SOLVR|nr:hypothetical protein MTR67_008787 [Solanum verrucosum]